MINLSDQIYAVKRIFPQVLVKKIEIVSAATNELKQFLTGRGHADDFGRYFASLYGTFQQIR